MMIKALRREDKRRNKTKMKVSGASVKQLERIKLDKNRPEKPLSELLYSKWIWR